MRLKKITIATRKSPLALWQANFVKQKVLQHFPDLNINLQPMVTSGDRFLAQPVSALGGKGLFVKELEEALLNQQADFAVHSMKDVPSVLPESLYIAAICQRDNPFDAFLSANWQRFSDLPAKAVIGTVSLRRQSQLLYQRPDILMKPLRGNIQTRISKLEANEYDAIILAAAGIERMGLTKHVRHFFDETTMLPACGQGALGIECRKEDERLTPILNVLNDQPTSICVEAERIVNRELGGSCSVPLAVFAQIINHEFNIQARIATPDGKILIAHQAVGSVLMANQLAMDCVKGLIAKGAMDVLKCL